MDTIDTLLNIERELTLWFFMATPADEPTRLQMQRVLAIRDRLHHGIDELVLKRAQVAGLALAGPAATLDELNQRIQATAKRIESAQEVFSLGAQVVTIVLDIVKLVA